MSTKKKLFRLIIDVYKTEKGIKVKTDIQKKSGRISVLLALGALEISKEQVIKTKLISSKVIKYEAKN